MCMHAHAHNQLLEGADAGHWPRQFIWEWLVAECVINMLVAGKTNMKEWVFLKIK